MTSWHQHVHVCFSFLIFFLVSFYGTLQDQEGLAEEEVWSEVWLPDNFSQHGEVTRIKWSPSIQIHNKVHLLNQICPMNQH